MSTGAALDFRTRTMASIGTRVTSSATGVTKATVGTKVAPGAQPAPGTKASSRPRWLIPAVLVLAAGGGFYIWRRKARKATT